MAILRIRRRSGVSGECVCEKKKNVRAFWVGGPTIILASREISLLFSSRTASSSSTRFLSGQSTRCYNQPIQRSLSSERGAVSSQLWDTRSDRGAKYKYRYQFKPVEEEENEFMFIPFLEVFPTSGTFFKEYSTRSPHSNTRPGALTVTSNLL